MNWGTCTICIWAFGAFFTMNTLITSLKEHKKCVTISTCLELSVSPNITLSNWWRQRRQWNFFVNYQRKLLSTIHSASTLWFSICTAEDENKFNNKSLCILNTCEMRGDVGFHFVRACTAPPGMRTIIHSVKKEWFGKYRHHVLLNKTAEFGRHFPQVVCQLMQYTPVRLSSCVRKVNDLSTDWSSAGRPSAHTTDKNKRVNG